MPSGSPDIIVIGGGVIGLTCAWRLALRGAKVLVLERDEPSSGASAASLGVLAPPSPLGETAFHLLHRRSLSMFTIFVRELEEAGGERVNYTRLGSLEILPTETQYAQAIKEVKRSLELRMSEGSAPAYQLLSPQEAQEFEPQAKVSPYGALLCRTSACVSVEAVMSALRTSCTRAGVQVRYGSAVVKILLEPSGLCAGVSLGTEELFAAKVLAAAGAWTGGLSPELKLYADIRPVRGQACLVRGEPRLVRRIIKWDKRYVVPSGEGAFTLGSTTEKESGFDASATVGGIEGIFRSAIEAVPKIAESRIERIWAGLRPAAPDSKPHLGAVPGVEGLFVAAGHYKIGFGLAPLTGEAMADLLLNEKTEFDLSSLAPRTAEEAKKRK